MIPQLKLAYFVAILNAAVIGVTYVPALLDSSNWLPWETIILLGATRFIIPDRLLCFANVWASACRFRGRGIISAMTPVVTMLFASLFLKEKTTWMQKLSLLLSASGIVFIYIMNGSSGWSQTTGTILLVLACITLGCWNEYVVGIF
ncbi:EamA family transporter [Paenibacillus sp. MB22_1]|uniref:EamA family transporter n=1 Tax=Paenibacillus sp. MB22_1 TaxID=3383121 RepID=UPI0039A18902